eukprot:768221-Hanusia_phi.AAC.12
MFNRRGANESAVAEFVLIASKIGMTVKSGGMWGNMAAGFDGQPASAIMLSFGLPCTGSHSIRLSSLSL